MASGVYIWSQTAGSNATADSSINWAEGQAPSSLNDSARAMMASMAKYRDDTCGANMGTGGTSTAYTLASNQVFDSTTHMAAQELTIYPHATNGADPTLNVDGLGAFPIVTDGAGTAVPAGTLVAGTPYELTFVNASSHWRLKNFFVKPYEMPLGAILPYAAATVPNNTFAFPSGQAISRTTYAALFALISTTYGSGDGSTTFNLPDFRGRLPVAKDNMNGVAAGRVTAADGGIDGVTLGATGGAQITALVTSNLPPYTPAGTIANGAITITQNANQNNGAASVAAGGNAGITVNSAATISASQATSTFTGTAQGGTSAPISRMPPGLVCNYIMRII